MKGHFLFLFSSWGFFGKCYQSCWKPTLPRRKDEELCGVSASQQPCFFGFCWFSHGWGCALSPVGSAWDSPLGTSPVLEHHLSTAGCFHGDHSRASLHGYGGTLAVGWGADAGAWGPSQDRAAWGTAGLAGWGQQVTISSWRTVCHCCQHQGTELSSWHSLRPALSLWEQGADPSPINHLAPKISRSVTASEGGGSSVPPPCRCPCPQESRGAQEQGPPQESQPGALFWPGSHDVHLHQSHEESSCSEAEQNVLK